MESSLPLKQFGIKIRDENSRFWVVRASGGEFIPHFIKGGVAAIGHLDGMGDRPSSPGELSNRDIEAYLTQKINTERATSNRRKIGNTKSQVTTFLHEIKPGDTLVSLDTSQLAVGEVTDKAFFSSEKIDYSYWGEDTTSMSFQTRIPVEWKHTFNRRELPLAVKNSLQAHQTVFSLEKHWTYIYHLIYAVFADQSNIYVSNYIHQREDVSSYAMAKLLSFYSDVEALLYLNTKEQEEAFDALNFEEALYLFRHQESGRHLSFKTEVFSEGPVWLKMPLKWISDYRSTIFVVTVIIALFGGELGPLTLPGIITPKMREAALDFILQRMKENDMQNAKRELQLDIPRSSFTPSPFISHIKDDIDDAGQSDPYEL